MADISRTRHARLMQIRGETAADEEEISTLITAAFLEAEHSGGKEAQIVQTLRAAECLTLSLVACENERIVGHVAFSPVTIDGRSEGWFGLGPVAVAPDRQRRGIGSALIRTGLADLREQGARGCVVLGDPAFYARFGFAADPNLRLPEVPADYFQRLSFDEQQWTGIVEYHAIFAAA